MSRLTSSVLITLAILTLLPLSLLAQTESPKAPAEPSRPAMSFRWPEFAEAVVTEEVTKRGQESTLRYRISLSPPLKSGERVLSISHFEFLNLMGMDVTKPEVKKQYSSDLKQLAVIAAAIPDLKISPEGRAGETQGYDEMLKVLQKFIEDEGKDESATVALAFEAMKDPSVRKTIEEDAAKFWHCWVENWLVPNPPLPDESATYMSELPGASGKVAEVPLKITNWGPDPKSAKHLGFDYERVVKGDAAKKSLSQLLAQFTAALRRQGKLADQTIDSQIEELSITEAASVTTDPKTLVPIRAEMKLLTRVKMKGMKLRTIRESHTYTFKWLARPTVPATSKSPKKK